MKNSSSIQSEKIIVFIPDSPESRDGLECLYQRGISTLVIGKKEWLADVDYTRAIDVIENENFHDIDLIISLIRTSLRLKNRDEHNIVQVLAFTESRIEIAAQLNGYWGCEGLSYNTCHACRDKYLMRRLAKNSEINVPLFCDPTVKSEREMFYEILGEKCKKLGKEPRCLLKRRSLWGCQDIQHFYSREEFELYLSRKEIEKDQYLLEEFIEGEMYAIGGAVVKNKIAYEVAVRYGKPALEFGRENYMYVDFYSIDQHAELAQRLKAFHEDVVKKFGLSWCLTDVEVLVEIQTGKIFLCEVACRHSSHRMLKLHEKITEKNTLHIFMNALADHCEGKNPTTTYMTGSTHKHVGHVIFLSNTGNVLSATDLSAFSDPEVVYREECCSFPKEFKKGVLDNFLGVVMVAADTESRRNQLLESYKTRYKIKKQEEVNA